MSKIIIKSGVRKNIANEIKRIAKSSVIITDKNLVKIALDIKSSLNKSDMKCEIITIASGEKTKSLAMVEKICRDLVKKGVRRDSVIIGVGGGVIGDLVGFVASIYMRGIPFVSIPTTMLAMADASIGSKNGVNLPEGKNLIGTFTEPLITVIDPELNETLPDKIFCEGMAEIIKHAIIADKKLFEFLWTNSEKILKRESKSLEMILKKSVEIKLNIISEDRHESIHKKHDEKTRMLLNYGHTVGHALEQLSKYTLLHGEAISIGMVAENKIAVEKQLLTQADADRIKKLFEMYKLPTVIPLKYPPKKILSVMKRDKKVIDGKIFLAVPTTIGNATVTIL